MLREPVGVLLLLFTICSCVEAVTPPPEPLCGNGLVDDGEACDASAEGSPRCTQSCTPPRCGDGHLDEDEPCDASSGVGPACTQSCTLELCGNGHVDEREACDPADRLSPPCNSDCTTSVCGDGLLGPDESCDPDDDPACGQDCRPLCGNGVVDAGEGCDEGPANGLPFSGCTVRCVAPSCGDGLVAVPAEQCDGGDRCGPDCRFEGCAALTAVAADTLTAVARADGRLFVTGDLLHAGLADARPPDTSPGLVELPGAPAFVVLVGRSNALAGLTAEGRLVTFGDVGFGRGADGETAWIPQPSTRFREPMPERRFVDVVATTRGFLALEAGGAVFAFGGDVGGSLGPTATERTRCRGLTAEGEAEGPCFPTPIALAFDAGVEPVRLVSGETHAGFVGPTGELVLWGENAWRQTGQPSGEACVLPDVPRCTPPRLLIGRPARRATGGADSTALLDPAGRVRGFGRTAAFGLPGDEALRTQDESYEPEGAPGVRFVDLAGAGAAYVLLDEDGALWAMGEATFGRLPGQPNQSFAALVPLDPAPGARFTAVSLAATHGLAVRADGGVTTWGDRGGARLGDPMEPNLFGTYGIADLPICP